MLTECKAMWERNLFIFLCEHPNEFQANNYTSLLAPLKTFIKQLVSSPFTTHTH